ncbi:hypothetical protein K493DRAFT_311453 [Basidiobolus meristosporus CBS 931.73]|uniref:Uncharacterized protein n=1 Tax=Basidiobolus meristosporus CBS 931.73 TaxID=1314790 RepID=A0A1Y1Z1I7_9FUNG|nr:hypothetical protein K493DRAFT_311453 [Basidiobolus meristosporus CBS 931.73]|eukprot:ORY04158.1 hypothetical protein K493DRAFT_311453 [Basidiobolus meristosporus CBS 931.73]
MFAFLSCCLPTSNYTRVPECPSLTEKEGLSSINAFSSRVISRVIATETIDGGEDMPRPLQCDKGARICVVDKTDDYFIGFLENDSMRALGTFSIDKCQVDRTWLVEKLSECSISSDSEAEPESRNIISEVIVQEPEPYSIGLAKSVEIEV